VSFRRWRRRGNEGIFFGWLRPLVTLFVKKDRKKDMTIVKEE
jgi:hypothetical protein